MRTVWRDFKKPFRVGAIAATVLAAIPFVKAPVAQADAFKFIAFGDMPYGEPARVFPPFEALIDTINKRNPAFSIHIGDTKSSGTPCSDEALDAQLDFMGRFTHPLIYTPGDNEWTDCHFERSGSFDPIDRLSYIRRTYFADPTTSLGQNPMPVESQAVVMAGRFPNYPENTRFVRDDVHFVQAHVVGSNNNLEARSLRNAEEFFERDRANLAWLNHGFDQAEAEDAKALVLSIHANMFEFGFGPFWNPEEFLRHSGFKNFGDLLVQRASAFKKPVLLIYGDSHKLNLFRPFRKTAPNIMALEVYGARNMHAVEVSVDTNELGVFGIKPVLNPALQEPE
ncbi:MAG: hypothetical protein AAGE61_19720 [Pseudomonadota bacterium]